MDYSSGHNAPISDIVPSTSDSATISSSTVPTVGSVSVGIEGRLGGNFAQLNSLLSPTDIEPSSGPVPSINPTEHSVHTDSVNDVLAALTVLDNVNLNNHHIVFHLVLSILGHISFRLLFCCFQLGYPSGVFLFFPSSGGLLVPSLVLSFLYLCPSRCLLVLRSYLLCFHMGL